MLYLLGLVSEENTFKGTCFICLRPLRQIQDTDLDIPRDRQGGLNRILEVKGSPGGSVSSSLH